MAKPEKSTKDEAEGSAAKNRTRAYIIGAVVAAVAAGAILYFTGNRGEADPDAPKQDPDVAALMEPGPLKDIVIGKADAPNTVVEYASMTCSHCAEFHIEVLPKFKEKYIDTGKARYILREFPLDGLAVAAFMLARCADDDRYYPMVGGLFETQKTWAVQGEDGKQKLLLIAKQAGFSQEQFDKCLDDKDLFNKIVEVRQRAHDEFGVDSTPTFFINGQRLPAGHEIEDFDAVLEGGKTDETPPPSG
ncbi:MAG: DsbA family protein [Methyloceanibacter sp.]